MLRLARVSSFPRAHFLHFFRSIIIGSITTNFVGDLYVFYLYKVEKKHQKNRFKASKNTNSQKFKLVHIRQQFLLFIK
nr:hypothetical protein [Mucilaginibacter sp. X5P1]